MRLVTRAVAGGTDLAEAVHATVQKTVAWPFGLSSGFSSRPRRARGIAGGVYECVRKGTRGVGRAADALVRLRGDQDAAAFGTETSITGPSARDAAVAALNGILGDMLAADGNPLAIPMQFRYAGRPLTLNTASLAGAVPAPSRTLLVHVHGLCMHDGQWGDEQHDPAAVLAAGLEATPLALRYNSGRHVSQNGRDFAEMLDALVASWPRPVQRIVVVGHSMGGLVARSAFCYAAEAGYTWPACDASLVTLGTPHHGAPLERLGHGIEALLGATCYTAPFARIGQIRSAGVTDLRFGNVLDEDWAGRDRFAHLPDVRRAPALPENVSCFFVAATMGEQRDGLGARWCEHAVGDGLVTVDSALGRHADPGRTLGGPEHRQWVIRDTTHFGLLRRPEVTARLLAWLKSPSP